VDENEKKDEKKKKRRQDILDLLESKNKIKKHKPIVL
jgi:hypothetical protein